MIEDNEFKKLKNAIKALFDLNFNKEDIIDILSSKEIWTPIEDFDNKYSFSNLGRVMSNKKGIILKPTGNWFEDWDGDFCLCYGLSKNGKRVNFYVKDPFIPDL